MRCKFLAVYEINYRLDEKTFPRARRVGVSPCELCRLSDSSEIHFVHIIYVHVLSDIVALVARLVDNLAAPVTRGILYDAVRARRRIKLRCIQCERVVNQLLRAADNTH